jgi:hypothetical protein
MWIVIGGIPVMVKWHGQGGDDSDRARHGSLMRAKAMFVT